VTNHDVPLVSDQRHDMAQDVLGDVEAVRVPEEADCVVCATTCQVRNERQRTPAVPPPAGTKVRHA